MKGLLEEIQLSLFDRADERRTSTTTRVDTWEEFLAALEAGGFVEAHWDGTSETEDLIKKETKATIRCIPLEGNEEAGQVRSNRSGLCPACGVCSCLLTHKNN